jgi:hypothetical protein
LWEWWDTLAGSTKATGGPHTVRVTRVTYLWPRTSRTKTIIHINFLIGREGSGDERIWLHINRIAGLWTRVANQRLSIFFNNTGKFRLNLLQDGAFNGETVT